MTCKIIKHWVKIGFPLLITINLCRGQDSTGTETAGSFHALGITLGLNQVKEENLLPRVHSGFITTLSYDYLRIGKRYQDFRFALGYSRILANPEDVTKSANLMITTSYSHCFRVVEEQSLEYFIGPQAKLAYSISLYPNWDESHMYWADFFSIGIDNAASYTLSERTGLLSTLSIALLSVYSRPDVLRLYKIDDVSFGGIVEALHQDLKPGFLNVVSSIHFDIQYEFPVFRKKKEAVFYSFDFTSIGKGHALPFAQLFHQLGLRILL